MKELLADEQSNVLVDDIEVEEIPPYIDPDEDPDEGKIYKQLLRAHNKRVQDSIKDTECKHTSWIKKCSICRTILESDARVNTVVGESSMVVYNNMERFVVRHYLSGRLKKLGVRQKSQFYWVQYIEQEMVTLRLKENVSMENTVVTSAFTCQEMCAILLTLNDKGTCKSTNFLEKLALVSNNPNILAKTLIRVLRNKDV